MSFFKLAGEADSLLRARMDMAEGQIARFQQPRRARPLARRNQPFSSRFCRWRRWPVEGITRAFCAMASENIGLEETIRDVTTLNASDVPAAVLASIAEFERGSHANDDKTLVVLRRT